MARTAMFVSKHGGQSEIVLRVKQGDNPTFGFLMPHHHLHPYFRYLVDHPELLKPDGDGKSLDGKNNDNQTSGALSLLGSLYGSGEDEDGVAEVPRESEQVGSAETSSAGGGMSKSHHSEQTAIVAQKDEIISKHPHSSKAKATALNKNRITSIKPALPYAVKKDGEVRGSTSRDIDKSKASGLFPISKAETLIVDPPSEVKRLVDRIVEIILKNGKDFEAVLVEQDKKHGKFPFLLPSNQYHAYYLKVLKKAQESRLSSKSFSSEKDGSSWHELDRRSASVKESDFPSSGTASHELPLEYDDDRKEKFKMVLGKSKKDLLDQHPKDTQQQPAVQVDAAAAAAILQAATRGIKKPYLDIFSKTSSNGANHGLSSEAGQVSSSLQSSQLQNSAQKPQENGKPSVTVPVAKEIAKTAALAAASEADSSEAGLTREQKLKAERLRRAKMFAAMIKSSVAPLGKEPPRALSVDLPGSGISGSATKLVNEEGKDREGSYIQAEGVTSDRIEKSRRNSSSDENELKSRKRRHYRSRKHDDSEGEEDEGKRGKDDDEEKEEQESRHSRKKHRSHHSSRHHRGKSDDRHRHGRKHSSKSKENRLRHKHESSSEDDDDFGRHHRRKHDVSSSEDEHRHHKRKHKHDSSEDERKHRKRRHKESQKDKQRHEGKSRKEEKSYSEEVELEEGEIRAKSSDQSLSTAGDRAYREASVEGSKSSNQEARTPSLPPETAEVPDDLRAKIRAMLLATM